MPALEFQKDGAVLHPSAALPIVSAIEAALARTPVNRAGARLSGNLMLAEVAGNAAISDIVTPKLGPARAVRAILFDKTPALNWSLGWHQDRTIAVVARHDVPGWGPWTLKAGIRHVEPPFDLIEQMVTLRIHLDPVPADNAPLLIAPGSHRLGRVPEPRIGSVVGRRGSVACLAQRGDVWAYATPILHASGPSAGYPHRRVLQIDFARGDLPSPLEWLGL